MRHLSINAAKLSFLMVLLCVGLSGFVRQIATPVSAAVRTNVALASNGGVATASSFFSGAYSPSSTIDGDRKGANWGNNGGWNDATPSNFPDWLQVDFAGTKTIDEIDVFAIQDSYKTPSEPTQGMTFS